MLGAGKVLEFDHPEKLLSNESSEFSILVKQTGAAEAEHLKLLAKTRSFKIHEPEVILVENQKHDDMNTLTNERDPLLV